MINAIHGSVVSVTANELIIRAGFMEFSLLISSCTASDLINRGNASTESETAVYTHLVHREDSMTLYGFSTAMERSIFLELIKVQGIGPRQAVKILSGISSRDLIAALDSGNLAVLTAIPGLGTKTAQKMVLTLRDKLTNVDGGNQALSASGGSQGTGHTLAAEIVQSLTDMGYDKRAARKVVDEVIEELKDSASKLAPADLEKKIFTAALFKMG